MLTNHNEIARQSKISNLLANTKADNRHCVKLRKNRNIPNLGKQCISQLEEVNAKGEPFKSKRLWGDCCKELVLSGHDYTKIIPARLVKKFENSVMNTSPVPTAEPFSADDQPSTTTLNTRANLRKMRNNEAERERMERQRREMERQRQEMERRQQAQRNSDINKLEQAFKTLTLPTNNKTNNFKKRKTHHQLEVLFKKLDNGESLTSNNRSYIQEVINSSKHKGSLLNRIRKKFTRSGGGLTKKKYTTPKRKLNTHKRTSITNKKKLNTRKRKYITNKKQLNTHKRKSNTHKRK